MNQAFIKTPHPGRKAVDLVYESMQRRSEFGGRDVDSLELTLVYLKLCHAQSCGKCAPCRIGLLQLINMIENAKYGDIEDLNHCRQTASVIAQTADCAIGFEAADTALKVLEIYAKDFDVHIDKSLNTIRQQSTNCRYGCPADVNIPGYIALCADGKYEEAARLIRQDNPLPSVCALICEHPCDRQCRRGFLDDAINIRAIKRAIMDHISHENNAVASQNPTGKKIGIIGGGACGLTAAYFLANMGHSVTIYEKHKRLGGMLRYGIPRYRLPDRYLDNDIHAVLAAGVTAVTESEVGKDIDIKQLRGDFDAILVTIGAHGSKSLGIPGEESSGVLSAVTLFSDMGDDIRPEFKGKDIVIIGGGNVAMDAARTSVRLGAASVRCVYRRRIADMTALPEEVEGAMAEGVEMVTLRAPVRIETDSSGNVCAAIFKPQVIGNYRGGRPTPKDASLPEERITCDYVIMAVGQDIDSKFVSEIGIPLNRGMLKTDLSCAIPDMPGVFAGGDCVNGPETVIRAIEAGKVSALNIDAYLGFSHSIKVDIEIPHACHGVKELCGRVENGCREALIRKTDFEPIELPLTDEEIKQECSRCLRCDKRGASTLETL